MEEAGKTLSRVRKERKKEDGKGEGGLARESGGEIEVVGPKAG